MDTEPDQREMCSADSNSIQTSQLHTQLNPSDQFKKSFNSYSNFVQNSISKSENNKNNIMNSLSTSTLSIPSVSDVTESSQTSPNVFFSMMQSMPFIMLGQQLASAIGATTSTPFSSQNPNNCSNQTDFSIDSILSSDNSRLYSRAQTEYSLQNQLPFTPQSLLLTTWLQSQQQQQQQRQHQTSGTQQNFSTSQNSNSFLTSLDSQLPISSYPYNSNTTFEQSTNLPSFVSHPWFMNHKNSSNNISISDSPNSVHFSDSKHSNYLNNFNESSLKQVSFIHFRYLHILINFSKGSSSPSIPTSSSVKRKPQNRGPRIPFTTHQVTELENKFSNAQYLSSLEVNQLAKRLNLTDNRVSYFLSNYLT